MMYSLFQEVLLQILKQDDLQLPLPRNRLVLRGAESLLRIFMLRVMIIPCIMIFMICNDYEYDLICFMDVIEQHIREHRCPTG